MRFFPKRTIHLDFHNGPDIPDLGANFDAERFADTFAAAEVDSVTVFAKCHHGHLYYDTPRPQRHPTLAPGLDLLGEQVEALHRRGIRAPVYLSVQCDEYAANEHPEWLAMDGLSQVKRGDRFGAGWQILDMSSPYQDYVAGQIQEVIDRFAPLDGLFLDMCWDQPSTSKWAVKGMDEAGLDPESATDRARYARLRAHQYMGRFQALAEPHLADDVASGVWFNSRPKTALDVEQQFLRHIEIEALPSGGWGYSFFPYTARFVRPLGKPTLSHTGRFHKSWGDNAGLKPAAALNYETAQILAQGMTLGVGDVLQPDGTLNAAAYDLIGGAYRHARECEPHLEDTELAAEAAIVVEPSLGDAPGASTIGALRALQQLRVQFDVVTPASDLTRYALLVVPESTDLAPDLAAKLAARAAAGTGILLCRNAETPQLDPEAEGALGFGIGTPIEYSHTFLRPDPELGLTWGYEPAVYRRGVRLSAEGATTLCRLVAPHFERAWDRFSGHSYTPSSGRALPEPGIIQRGNVIVSGIPLFESVAEDAAVAHRELLGALIARLLPRPLVRAAGPVHLETALAVGDKATVLHLISYLARRASEQSGQDGNLPATGLDLVEDPFPLMDVAVQIRTDRPVAAVTLEPRHQQLAFTQEDGYVATRVTTGDGHAMVVVRHVV